MNLKASITTNLYMTINNIHNPKTMLDKRFYYHINIIHTILLHFINCKKFIRIHTRTKEVAQKSAPNFTVPFKTFHPNVCKKENKIYMNKMMFT